MGQKSIGNLHATVTANAAQFANEMGRADNVMRQKGAAIRSEIDKVASSVQKKWGLTGRTGMVSTLIKATGFGSGAAAMALGWGRVWEALQEGAENTRDFAEAMQDALKAGRELSELRFTNFLQTAPIGTQKEELEKRLNVLRQQLAEAETNRATVIADLASIEGRSGLSGTVFDPTGGKYGYGMGMKALGDKLSTMEQDAQRDIDRLSRSIEKWDLELRQLNEKKMPEALDKALDAVFKPLDDAQKKIEDRWDSLEQKFRDAVKTPLEKFEEVYTQAWELFDRGRLSYPETRRVISRAQAELDKDSEPKLTRWERAMGSLNIDAYTKRGLGVGADYAALQSKQADVLTEIRDILRNAIRAGFTPSYGI
jgi:hypothetical protein